jgi:hypothetical protein
VRCPTRAHIQLRKILGPCIGALLGGGGRPGLRRAVAKDSSPARVIAMPGGHAPGGRGPTVPAPARRGRSEGASRARGPRASGPRRGGVASLWPSRVGAALRGRHEPIPGSAERPSAGGRAIPKSRWRWC